MNEYKRTLTSYPEIYQLLYDGTTSTYTLDCRGRLIAQNSDLHTALEEIGHQVSRDKDRIEFISTKPVAFVLGYLAATLDTLFHENINDAINKIAQSSIPELDGGVLYVYLENKENRTEAAVEFAKGGKAWSL